MTSKIQNIKMSLWDIADYVNGRLTKPSELLKHGLPVIKIAELNRGISNQTNLISKVIVQPKHLIQEGDLLFAWSGTIGIHIYEGPEAALNQHIFKVTAREMIDQNFLRYLLEYELFNLQRFVEEKKTTMGHVTIANLKTVEVEFPRDVDMQKKIACYLGSIDSMLSINTSKSKTLEDIAQTIFKSWFIDFDPVKAKMNGEKPIGMDDETAALFPDSFEESELGLIPKGWEVGTIKDICQQVVNGSTPLRTKGEFWADGEIDWYKTGELSDNFLFESKERISIAALEKTSVKILPKGSVLMAIYAAPTVGRLGILTKESTFNQASTGMVVIETFGTPYLYLTLFNKRDWFNSLAIGAAQQNISKVIVESCPTLIANEEVHASFLKLTKSVFQGIETLGSQTNTLKVIRDSLLPRLISGELQIPEEMLAS